MDSLAIYVHVPYCVKKCAYCDFNAFSGADSAQVQVYVESVRREIADSEYGGRRVETVFFGGGTPTYLSGPQIGTILTAIRERFKVDANAEISSEANPSSADAERFREMRDAGFNRLSVGVQSFDDRLLKLIDRTHSAEEAVRAVQTSRRAGFRNLSIDLMFGLPGQSVADWNETLDRAIALDLPHVSTYALTLEPGTRFERLHAGGKLILPDEDVELDMFEMAIQRLTDAGFEHYEVSNFAKPGFRSRHNMVYWRNEEYIGFGPGAVSYTAGRRWTNEKNPALYAAKVSRGSDLAVESESLNPESALAETVIQGLRMRDGVDVEAMGRRFGVGATDRLESVFQQLATDGLLERSNGVVRLTHRGLLFSNDVSLAILP